MQQIWSKCLAISYPRRLSPYDQIYMIRLLLALPGCRHTGQWVPPALAPSRITLSVSVSGLWHGHRHPSNWCVLFQFPLEMTPMSPDLCTVPAKAICLYMLTSFNLRPRPPAKTPGKLLNSVCRDLWVVKATDHSLLLYCAPWGLHVAVSFVASPSPSPLHLWLVIGDRCQEWGGKRGWESSHSPQLCLSQTTAGLLCYCAAAEVWISPVMAQTGIKTWQRV